MAEPVQQEQAGSVKEKTDPPSLKKQFGAIMLRLYESLIHSRGIYGLAKIDTHAPQVKYYPGSPALKRTVTKIKEHHDGLVGMPTSNEVKTMIREFCERVSVDSQYHIDLDVEWKITAMQLSAEQSAQLARLRILLDDALEREAEEAEIFVPTKVVERGSAEHIRWLWFATLTDRREVSERVYRAHCKIYEQHPEFYTKEVAFISAPKFQAMLRDAKYTVGSPDQSAGYWQICAHTLFSRFAGNPIALLKEAGWSVEKAYAWKHAERKRLGYDPIPGWGRKLLSLYFLYLAELGYPLPDDAYPADVHAQAIAVQTSCVNWSERDVVYSSALAELIRTRLTSLCRSKNLDPVIMAHASWLLGSQLCTNCSKTREVKQLCPVYDQCRGRAETSMYFARGRWPKDVQIMNKGDVSPKYGLPTDFDPRVRTRKKGLTKRETIAIIPLFD